MTYGLALALVALAGIVICFAFLLRSVDIVK